MRISWWSPSAWATTSSPAIPTTSGGWPTAWVPRLPRSTPGPDRGHGGALPGVFDARAIGHRGAGPVPCRCVEGGFDAAEAIHGPVGRRLVFGVEAGEPEPQHRRQGEAHVQPDPD